MPRLNKDPRYDILSTLKAANKPITRTELRKRSSLGDGTLSKYLPQLIKADRVKHVIQTIDGSRVPAYSLLIKGEWEYRLHKITRFLNKFKEPVVGEKVLDNGKMKISFMYNKQDMQLQNLLDDLIKSKKFDLLLGSLIRNQLEAKNKEVALTIMYSPKAKFVND